MEIEKLPADTEPRTSHIDRWEDTGVETTQVDGLPVMDDEPGNSKTVSLSDRGGQFRDSARGLFETYAV